MDKPNIHTLRLDGGVLCLDFINTIDDRYADPLSDYLHDYHDLIAWGQHVNMLSESHTQPLNALAVERPEQALRVFHQAIRLREALYRIFKKVIIPEPPDNQDIALLNGRLSGDLTHLRIQATDKGFIWTWQTEPHLERILWPLTRSAAELLTAESLNRVKACPACGWLFFDSSKNHSRRWCSMETCGNTAKVRRFYHRTRR